MARATKTNSPQPYSLVGAANAAECSPYTVRNYLRQNLIEGVQQTQGGHYIFFEEQVAQIRAIYLRNRPDRA